ncbi:MAG: ABC transporter permease [Planctomycetota bacterium]
MISTVITIAYQRLIHNKVELAMTFVVPIAFFSIFALIFGGGMGTTPRVKTVVVDQVGDEASRRVVESISELAGLRMMRGSGASVTRSEAESMVREGSVTIAIVIRNERGRLAADLLADTSDQVAPPIVSALVTRSLIASSTPAADDPMAAFAERVSQNAKAASSSSADSEFATPIGDVAAKPIVDSMFSEPSVEVIDVMQAGKTNPVVSMYAAGIAVMFLLFGATNAGGALLEEKENQTLERLLATRLSMDQLLAGKWIYQTGLGALQVLVMFVWGQIVFGVDLIGHWEGFTIMTLVTSGAAAAFGLFLATICKSRGQLNGLSVIVILSMSALGGSMVPRYVMSESMREAGLWTFNAWALDGYDKVFWRDLPLNTLGPQLMVLVSCAVVFLAIARVFAIRWETD